MHWSSNRMRSFIFALAALAGVCLCLFFTLSDQRTNSGVVSDSGSTGEPVPTTTPHIAPLYPTLAAEYNRMTDVQQDRYLESLVGAEAVRWEAVVENVSESFGEYVIFADAGRPTAGSDVAIWGMSEDVAVSLNIGDRIVFSGQITNISTFLGLTVRIENAVIHDSEDDD